MVMHKRFTISVTEWQYSALEEIARLDEVSVSHVVRDVLRGTLPKMLELSRFLHDPLTTREDALGLAADMERVLARLTTDAEPEEAADGGVPARRRPASPPSSNTGAQYPTSGE